MKTSTQRAIVEKIDNKTVKTIHRLRYDTTAKLGWRRFIRYAYPTSDMAKAIGGPGYYIGCERADDDGREIVKYHPMRFAGLDSARDGIQAFCLHYLQDSPYTF